MGHVSSDQRSWKCTTPVSDEQLNGEALTIEPPTFTRHRLKRQGPEGRTLRSASRLSGEARSEQRFVTSTASIPDLTTGTREQIDISLGPTGEDQHDGDFGTCSSTPE